jgi:hypothetical protein
VAYVESGIYVEGLNNMIAGLKAISSEATREVQALNFRVGEMVVREAKAILPTTLVPLTKSKGDLQGSIKASRSLRGVIVTAGTGNSGDIPYANAQNWGWFYDNKTPQEKNILPKQFMNKGAAKVRARIGQFYIEDLIAIYNKYAKAGDKISADSYKNKQRDYTIRRTE